MQNNQEPQNNQVPSNNNRRQTPFNKQILFLICIYIVLSISNMNSKNSDYDNSIAHKIKDQSVQITNLTIINILTNQQWQGEWQQQFFNQQNKTSPINVFDGQFILLITRIADPQNQKLTIDIQLKRGKYVDQGIYLIHIPQINPKQWIIQRKNNNVNVKITLDDKNLTKGYFNQQNIFKTLNAGQISVTQINLNLQIIQNIVHKKFSIKTQNAEIFFQLHKLSPHMMGTIVFSLLLIIVSYSQFSACLQIIKNFIQGTQNPTHYSFLSLVMAMMWDAALCLTSFVQAFQNQQNIVLFIVPAFLLCLLFTNLQLRIMVLVFQANSGQTDIRQVICKFNLASYGGIIAMYPLIFFTNLGAPLFVLFSLIFIPQIYTNAMLYLKAFPYNVFGLKPNYILAIGCLLIVALQYALLNIQKIYGPKTVLPKFLLPPVFNYKYQSNLQQLSNNQCAICLQSLSKQPQQHPNDIQIDYKIMKTPCQHKYHSCCLTQWMRLKMQCPQCRAKLPSYQ